MLKQAVILAGGLGTRLGEMTQSVPKPMIQVDGIPFLEYIIRHLRNYQVTDIVLSIGYLSKIVEEHFGDGEHLGVKLQYVVEEKPAGTGGFLSLARPLLGDEFLVLNGDTLFDLNLHDLYCILSQHPEAEACIAARKVEDTSRFGSITVEGNQVTRFDEKNRSGPGQINGGVYILRKSICERAGEPPTSMENDILKRIVDEGKAVAGVYDGFFIDMGIPESLTEARRTVPKWWRKPVAFLDRDGVININKGYVNTPERFEWVSGAPEAIKLLNDSGFRVIVVTNQAGIARGYYTEDEFHAFMEWISGQLRNRAAHWDDYYFSPYHPTQGNGDYRRVTDCRKPGPGMLLRALDQHPSDITGSFLIGDKPSDLEAAERAGVAGHLFDPENDDLQRFVKSILDGNQR